MSTFITIGVIALLSAIVLLCLSGLRDAFRELRRQKALLVAPWGSSAFAAKPLQRATQRFS